VGLYEEYSNANFLDWNVYQYFLVAIQLEEYNNGRAATHKSRH